MPKDNLRRKALLLALIITLCILPFRIGVYNTEVMITLFINVVLVASYFIMVRMGAWSLGHAVTMGIGCYTTALIAKSFNIPFFLIVLIGGLAGAGWMLILSYPLSKMKGFALFIGSFAAAEALRLAWIIFRDPFGGVRGLINVPYPSIMGVTISGTVPYYFMVLCLMLVCLAIIYRIDRSKIGDALKAIASKENLADSIGINLTRYKCIAFVLSGFFAGVTGVFLVSRLGSVDPHLFALYSSFNIVIWLVIGGYRTLAGPIIGLSFYTLISESIRNLTEWRPFVLGIIIIIFLIFMPGGIESFLPKCFSSLKKLFSKTKL